MRFVQYDAMAHSVIFPPAPHWLQHFEKAWRTYKPGGKSLQFDDGYIKELAADILKWLQTLPDGKTVNSRQIADIFVPAPDDVDADKWRKVFFNVLGRMRFLGSLDGHWFDVPNKRRPTKPWKNYHNGNRPLDT